MKHIIITLFVFCSAAAMACGIHQFKVPLNQRGFYNPAALCPYCEGSSYFGTGAFAGIRSNDFGMFVSLGNDAGEKIHGAWDATWARTSNDNTSTNSFSTRYAWKQSIGSWMLGIGLRGSYNTYTMLLATPESVVSKATRQCFGVDAGMYITNQGGFYAGMSVLNIHEPTLAMKFELPGGPQYYEVKTQRSYAATVGGLVQLNRRYDLMLDAGGSLSKDVQTVRPSFMVRYKHHIGFGGGVTISNDENPVLELQGGFTSTPLKWLVGVAFTEQGPVIETGIVARFGVEKWRFTSVTSRCVAQPIKEPRRTEFFKED